LSIAAVGLCLAVVFLPWARSGSVDRSGYDLLGSAQRAGLVTASWARGLAVTAYLLPTMAAATVAAWMVGRPRLALVVAAVTGVVLAAGSSVVIAVVHGGLLAGAPIGAGVGCTTALFMAQRLGGRRNAGHHGRRHLRGRH
jgi:hypothetical protein